LEILFPQRSLSKLDTKFEMVFLTNFLIWDISRKLFFLKGNLGSEMV
jgi:hypothetical protein